jgi:hypothetical protein
MGGRRSVGPLCAFFHIGKLISQGGNAAFEETGSYRVHEVCMRLTAPLLMPDNIIGICAAAEDGSTHSMCSEPDVDCHDPAAMGALLTGVSLNG